MVFDKIANASQYYGLGERIEKALRFIEAYDPASHEAGKKIEIDGDLMFGVQAAYENKPACECIAEAHRAYIDIMTLVDGDEAVAYVPIEDVEVTQEYSANGDALLGKFPADAPFIPFKKGYFAIFFPQDGHVTCARHKQPGLVKKLIVKVKI